eukprot:TRINITY_DN26132_c0_g1_i1.p1 TRINITY_DN26132_c0_g1~~TRINITY_DN26132_c0_g1_i1.p1  ORF type:complete len:250 (+),score=3.20 TRINITY_DN26132_c0_g1_i1:242-991(+)
MHDQAMGRLMTLESQMQALRALISESQPTKNAPPTGISAAVERIHGLPNGTAQRSCAQAPSPTRGRRPSPIVHRSLVPTNSLPRSSSTNSTRTPSPSYAAPTVSSTGRARSPTGLNFGLGPTRSVQDVLSHEVQRLQMRENLAQSRYRSPSPGRSDGSPPGTGRSQSSARGSSPRTTGAPLEKPTPQRRQSPSVAAPKRSTPTALSTTQRDSEDTLRKIATEKAVAAFWKTRDASPVRTEARPVQPLWF